MYFLTFHNLIINTLGRMGGKYVLKVIRVQRFGANYNREVLSFHFVFSFISFFNLGKNKVHNMHFETRYKESHEI